MISLKDLSKTYFQGTHRIEVLYKLNLEVKANESLAILGQSGSGKSTLLSLLAGLDSPDFGSIHIDGNNLAKLNQNELANGRTT